MNERSFVQQKMLTEKHYAPYCGKDHCFGRCPFNGKQFQCIRCGWQSQHTDEFIAEYKQTWGMQ